MTRAERSSLYRWSYEGASVSARDGDDWHWEEKPGCCRRSSVTKDKTRQRWWCRRCVFLCLVLIRGQKWLTEHFGEENSAQCSARSSSSEATPPVDQHFSTDKWVTKLFWLARGFVSSFLAKWESHFKIQIFGEKLFAIYFSEHIPILCTAEHSKRWSEWCEDHMSSQDSTCIQRGPSVWEDPTPVRCFCHHASVFPWQNCSLLCLLTNQKWKNNTIC